MTDRLGQKGDTKHLAEVLFSHCVSNRHVTETTDEAIFRQKMVNGVALRDLAFTVQRRGPKRCAKCGGSGFVVTERNGVSGAGPCECRAPRDRQVNLFGGTEA